MLRTSTLALVILATAGCTKEAPPPPPPTPAAPAEPAAPSKPTLTASELKAFAPLPTSAENAANPSNPDKVALGKQLYFDKRLSKNHDISCNSCHALATYGVDNAPTSTGHKKQLGGRNSPTSFNAALHFRQFWDGRAGDVEEQAVGPIANPVEMASDEKKVVATMNSIPAYVEAFKKAFPGEKSPVTFANVGRAIAAFERTLLTPSRFDKFLNGDNAALNDGEVKGAKTFISLGCMACHMGPLLGGAMYQKLGLVKPWPEPKDLGRFEATKAEGDKLMFKVPSLRNIEKTGPYFHDGSVGTLEKAVALMAEHQLGRTLDDGQIIDVVLFLRTLTGELPADVIAEPTLPASTKKTPKPDPS